MSGIKANTNKMKKMLKSKAMPIYITHEHEMYRYINGKINVSKFDYESNNDQPGAKIKVNFNDLDKFEEHYIETIVAVESFRKFFFNDSFDYQRSIDYFIFAPISVTFMKYETKNELLLYPVIKYSNDETIMMEFNYYPNENDKLSVKEFSNCIFEATNIIKEIKIPIEYIQALDLKYDINSKESFNYDSRETYRVKLENSKIDNFLKLMELFLNSLFIFDSYTWFGRSEIIIDNITLSDKEIYEIKNGISNQNANPRYLRELNDFSEHNDRKLIVMDNMTMGLGDILDQTVPITVIDEEICSLNAKILDLATISADSSINDLLNAKEYLIFLKNQVQHKYDSSLMAHEIMKYVINDLFEINNQINQISDLINIYFDKAQYSKTNNEILFQDFISVASLMFSTSVILDYVIKPMYMIVFKEQLSTIGNLLGYITVLILSIISVLKISKIIKKDYKYDSLKQHLKKR